MSRILELMDKLSRHDCEPLRSKYRKELAAEVQRVEADNKRLREALEDISFHAPWGGTKDKYIAWLISTAQAAIGENK